VFISTWLTARLAESITSSFPLEEDAVKVSSPLN
jgi:hypothetical protein